MVESWVSTANAVPTRIAAISRVRTSDALVLFTGLATRPATWPGPIAIPGSCGLGLALFALLELAAFDVDVRQDPSQPARQPPGTVLEDEHGGRDDCHADHEGIDQDTDSQREAERLRRRIRGEDEAGEDRGHDDRGRSHDLGAAGVAVEDGVGRALLQRFLAHPGFQEHLRSEER